jgi:hypothetical protein
VPDVAFLLSLRGVVRGINVGSKQILEELVRFVLNLPSRRENVWIQHRRGFAAYDCLQVEARLERFASAWIKSKTGYEQLVVS